MFPGWRWRSFGYHGDNGKLYLGRGSATSQKGLAEQKEDKKYGKGDTVGCGYDPEGHQVFFTHNGELLSNCASDVPAEAHYFPVVALNGLGTTVDVNFGDRPFVYDPTHWRARSAGDISCTPISAADLKPASDDD